MSGENILPEVATNFLTDCKKCETERYHKVLAHPTPKSAKLVCEVCGSKKTFKIGLSKKKSLEKKEAEEKNSDTWEKLKKELGNEKPASYNMKSIFEVQTAIIHPKFGLGFITSVTPQKIQVLFSDNTKFLVHNRQ